MQRTQTITKKLQDYYNARIKHNSPALNSHIASIHMVLLGNPICTRLNTEFKGENYSNAEYVMREIENDPTLVKQLLGEIAQALTAYELIKSGEDFSAFAISQLARMNPEMPSDGSVPRPAAVNPRSFSNTLASFFCCTGCDNDLEHNPLVPVALRYHTFKP